MLLRGRLTCLPSFCGHLHSGLRVSSAVCIFVAAKTERRFEVEYDGERPIPERIPFAWKVRGSITPPRASFPKI